jgi:hypothetical protein
MFITTHNRPARHYINRIVRLLSGAAACVLPHTVSVATQPCYASDVSVSISPDRIEQGGVARISVICPPGARALSYSWQSINAPLFSDASGSYFGFIPVDMDNSPGTTRLTIALRDASGVTIQHEAAFEVIARDFPVQRLTVDETKATLSTENLARHNRERAQVQKMFSDFHPDRLWNVKFTQPVQGRISTPFGVRRFINNQPRNPHSGIDIAAPTGTPIQAAADGRVCLTGDHFFAGKSVYIDHGTGIFSMYFHLDAINVQDGQMVKAGDTIGRVGSTGRSTGPHLHWGMRIYDTAVDPLLLLRLFE